MKAFLNFLNLGFLPSSADFGILLLRLGTGIGMVYLHGWNKWVNRDTFIKTWPDPLHLGSKEVSFYLLVFAEVVCAVLIAAGFLTRFAALALGFGMGVAFFVIHKGGLTGEKNGELAAWYCLACAAIFLTGAGKFSVDGAGVPQNDGK
jgi:putative oxidoreductase